MSVCGANNDSIKVIGALLIEFSSGPSANDSTTKQIVYICEGVSGVLLSLEACVELGLVNDNFPQSCLSASYGPAKKNHPERSVPIIPSSTEETGT